MTPNYSYHLYVNTVLAVKIWEWGTCGVESGGFFVILLIGSVA